MKKLLKLVAILTLYYLQSQAQNYNDVLVVVNRQSIISQKIGEYFKQQRNIPQINICEIDCSVLEEIDSVQFVQIRAQVENYLTLTQLKKSINYIVTTKGVPLKVRRFGRTFSGSTRSSSLDGELSLILSDLASSIENIGAVSNPYFSATDHFTRTGNFKNIFLVTRLDGYTFDDVKGLIERANEPYLVNGKFVFDRDPAWNSSLNDNMSFAKDTLVRRGFNVLLDSSSEFKVNQTNVLGYVSWGSNDHYWRNFTQKAQPHFTWSPKALAETYVSSSGRTFTDSNYIDPDINSWQSLVADLIHENGITGCKSYVYEPYSTSMAKAHILFDRWSKNFNLAESFYAASNYLGWMDVIIGDPKCTLSSNNIQTPVELTVFSGKFVSPNIQLEWQTATETNNLGFEVQKFVNETWVKIGFRAGQNTTIISQSYQFIDADVLLINTYRLKQIDYDGRVKYSETISVETTEKTFFRILQNYPNPFQESTTIYYEVSAPSKISVEVSNALGQIVYRSEKYETIGTQLLVLQKNKFRSHSASNGILFCKITAENISTHFSITKIHKLLMF